MTNGFALRRDQWRQLLRLRSRVTWRTYTATFQARLESLIFFPMVGLTAMGIQQFLYLFLLEVLDPRTFYRHASINLVMLLHVTLLFLFIGWTLVPAMGFRTNEALDLNKLRLLPIPTPLLSGASMTGYLLDFSTLLPLSMVFGVLRFMAVVIPRTLGHELRPLDWLGLLACGAELLALLLLGSMMAVQVFMHLLPKVDFTRVFSLVFFGFLALVIGMNLNIVAPPDGTTLYDERLIDLYNATPTGAVALAFHELAEQNYPGALRFLGWGVGWIVALGAAYFALVQIILEGRFLGLERWINTERITFFSMARNKPGAIPRWPAWVAHPALVVAFKDSRVLTRDRYFFFYKAVPGVMAPTIILLAGKYNLALLRDQMDLITGFLPLYLGMVLLLFIAQANLFIGNHFGFEREQIAAILTSPVPRRDLLYGKNLFLLGIHLPDICVIAFLSWWLIPGAPPVFLGLVFLILLTLIVDLIAIGNMSAVLVPYFTPLDRPVITLQGSTLIGLVNGAMLLALSAVMIPNALLLLGPIFLWKIPATYAITLPLWALWNVFVYRALTNWAGRLMPDYEEWIGLRVRGVL